MPATNPFFRQQRQRLHCPCARPTRSVHTRSPACQNKAPFRAVNRRRRVRRLRHRPNTIALPTCRRHPLRSGDRTIRAGPRGPPAIFICIARRVEFRASRYQQSRNLVRVRNGELQLGLDAVRRHVVEQRCVMRRTDRARTSPGAAASSVRSAPVLPVMIALTAPPNAGVSAARISSILVTVALGRDGARLV